MNLSMKAVAEGNILHLNSACSQVISFANSIAPSTILTNFGLIS